MSNFPVGSPQGTTRGNRRTGTVVTMGPDTQLLPGWYEDDTYLLIRTSILSDQEWDGINTIYANIEGRLKQPQTCRVTMEYEVTTDEYGQEHMTEVQQGTGNPPPASQQGTLYSSPTIQQGTRGTTVHGTSPHPRSSPFQQGTRQAAAHSSSPHPHSSPTTRPMGNKATQSIFNTSRNTTPSSVPQNTMPPPPPRPGMMPPSAQSRKDYFSSNISSAPRSSSQGHEPTPYNQRRATPALCPEGNQFPMGMADTYRPTYINTNTGQSIPFGDPRPGYRLTHTGRVQKLRNHDPAGTGRGGLP